MKLLGLVNGGGPVGLLSTVPLWAALGGFAPPYIPHQRKPPGAMPTPHVCPLPSPGQFGGVAVPAPRLSVGDNLMSEANYSRNIGLYGML